MYQNKWIILEFDKEKLSDLKNKLNLTEIVIKILLSRGFSDEISIRKFLTSPKHSLYSPFLFDDMHKSVLRIKQAIEKQEKILIYADRDVDGVTSLAIIFDTIKTLGGDVLWYVPSDEGYGLSNTVIKKYFDLGVSLIITVDCGISAGAEIAYANSLNMQVIVTDHHEPPDTIPDSYAVIDAKKSNCNYPCKDLAGCGVSFKVSQALMQAYGKYFDKEILITALQKENGLNNAYIITIVNDVIIKEQKFCFSANETDKLFDILKNKKVVTLKNEVFDLFEGDILFLDIENTDNSSLENSAYNLLDAYRKYDFENDGRMLEFFENNVDLVAIGTIADIVSLVGENRILVSGGLEVINKNYSKRFGLANIIDEYIDTKTKITAKDISWKITPVINAAGRMAQAGISAELLLADDKYRANDYFFELKNLNNKRKNLQTENMKEFAVLLRQQCDVENDKVFVVVADGLSHGVTGIVASQIVKKYSKPALLFISDGKQAVGACRSIEGFDIVGALEQTKDLLLKYGGHTQAAGLTIDMCNMPLFRQRIKEIAEKALTEEMLVKKINVDCEIKLSDVNKQTFKDISALEPFGCSNIAPIFMIKDVEFTEITVIGPTQEHLKFKVSQNGNFINAVFWGGAKYRDIMNYKNKFDILCNMEYNRGMVQLIVLDIKNIK